MSVEHFKTLFLSSVKTFPLFLLPNPNGRVSDKPLAAPSAKHRAISKTAHFTVVSTVSCTGYVVNKTNCLLCAYECDFGDNDIIIIV
jgi:hypothetical protein